MNSLRELHTELEKKLAQPLPGIHSQRKMMAKPDSKFRFEPGSRDNARHSGVLIVFYESEGQIKLPLILRHDYGGVHSGQVSFPGGRREPEDNTIVDTALREPRRKSE